MLSENCTRFVLPRVVVNGARADLKLISEESKNSAME